MMVSTSEQGSACRAAQGRRVESGELEAVVRQHFNVRCRHRATERRTHPEADIIEQDKQYVRAAFGGRNRQRVIRRRVLISFTDLPFELRVGFGQLCSDRRWEIGFRLLSRGVALPGGRGWHGEHAADHQRCYYNQYRFFHGAILV